MSFLGNLFGSAPSPPPPPPPPPHPPTIASQGIQQSGQAAAAEAAAASGAGFSDTLKTGSLGAPKPNTTSGASTLGG
jgi:hypothetical protein